MPRGSASRIATRELAAELAARVPRILRSLRRRRRPRATASAGTGGAAQVFGVLERDGRPPVPLLSGYRDTIKSSWRRSFWQVTLLFWLRERGELPPELEELAGEIAASRTLPVSTVEIGAAVEPLLRRSQDVVPTGRHDASGRETLAVRVSRDSLRSDAAYYRELAARTARELRRYGVDLRDARVVELGCGAGHLLHGLAVAGCKRLVGVDIDYRSADLDPTGGQALMRELVAGPAAAGVELLCESAAELPFEDGSFDVAISVSAFEHFRDPHAVLREQARVLRPGGLVYHSYQPWFSPAGGHSLSTLDFPWGHVRLTADEFESYIGEHRPYELEETLSSYRLAYQEPRLTLAEVERAALDHGFELLDWVEESNGPDHLGSLDAAVLDECRAAFPEVTVRDLVTTDHLLVARKRRSGARADVP